MTEGNNNKGRSGREALKGHRPRARGTSAGAVKGSPRPSRRTSERGRGRGDRPESAKRPPNEANASARNEREE